MVNLILSNVPNYQAILEETFLNFLDKEGVSEKTRKNYRTDLHHFIRWAVTIIQTNSSTLPDNHLSFLNHITKDLLSAYREHLIKNRVPSSTINRRLSALRIFLRCCQVNGWINENPAKMISNVTHQPLNPQLTVDQMLAEFRDDLAREGASKATIRNYLSDTRQFLLWLRQQERTEETHHSSLP